MNTPILLNVLDIYLDDQNPRHDPIKDQPKIFNYLLNKELVKPLAKDIAEKGLSPIELLAVMQDKGGSYIVLEGNRRLCALKLLNDPDKASENSRTYFRQLVEKASYIPKQVLCIVYNNREEADDWLDRRHNGQQGGVGVKAWDAEQKNRRNLNNKKTDPNTLAQTLLDYGRDRGFLGNFEKKIVTTAARYLGNPYFRKSVGIISDRSEADVRIEVSFIDFEVFLKVFCNDLIEGERVSSRSKKSDWEDYAKTLISEGVVSINVTPPRYLSERSQYIQKELEDQNKEQTGQNSNYPNGLVASTLADNNETLSNDNVYQNNTGTGLTGKPTTHTTTHNPDVRKYIIPRDFRATINDKILRRAFQELKEIEVNKYPLAVSLVTRAFLERTYILFYEAVQGDDLSAEKKHLVVGRIVSLIEKDRSLIRGEKNALKALRSVASNQNNILSPKTLGSYAHATYYPDPLQLKREFDNISPIIQYMMKRI